MKYFERLALALFLIGPWCGCASAPELTRPAQRPAVVDCRSVCALADGVPWSEEPVRGGTACICLVKP